MTHPMLYVNMLVEWSGELKETRVERLLYLYPGGEDVVMIDIKNPKAQPIRRKRVELESALEAGDARVLEVDPYARLRRPEDKIKASERKQRDLAYALIASLVESDDPRIFDFWSRKSPIHALAKKMGGRKKSLIYATLRRYWQRGQTKDALRPLFDQRGWRNRSNTPQKKEKAGAAQPKKLGAPSKLSKASGEKKGLNVDDEMRRRFRTGIKLFYETREARTLRQAYQLTLERFFSTGYYFNRNGARTAALPPADELPTYRQFRYWYKKDRKPRRAQSKRYGETRHNLSGRAVLGDATQMAFGPGSIYQIDATIGDCYLVSSLDRNRIIGRPVIYFVKDTMSRIVAGLSVTLEGPSWVGAMLALENATADKVAFCAEYGITIEEHDWPCSHLPEGLLADRGELEGYNGDHLVNAFNIRLHNTAPYRGDMKSIVEQHIDLTNEKFKPWVPGAVRELERGDRDYRLDAVLDLHEFRKLMILCAIDHNNHHRLEGYRLDKDMIADHVEPYPLEMWHWGIRNRSGHLRKMDADTIRLNLLPEVSASVTYRGIRCDGLYYTCETAQREQWFEQARENGTRRISVARDPRNTSRLYLRNGHQAEVCHLLEADRTFLNRDWYEALDEFELRKQRKEAAETRQKHSRAELHADTNKLVKSAKEKTSQGRNGVSDRARLASIRNNRKDEREREREQNAWKFGGDAEQTPRAEQSPDGQPHAKPAGYVPPANPVDKLRQLRTRRVGK